MAEGQDAASGARSLEYAQLLSLAVHELRTPASVVGGYLRMLLKDEDPRLSDRQRKMAEEAEKSCARLVALIAEISEVSKLDAGTLELGRQSFDLFDAVTEVADDVHEGVDRGVHLEVRGEASRAPIVGDRARLQQAFEAVFRAVLREQPGQVTVIADRRLARRGDRASAIVAVAAEQELQRVKKADGNAFDERRGGLGLKLPIARRIIERHGGHIASAEGSGARSGIVISLPIGS